MSVLQTVQKNNRQFTYGQTVQKNNKQFTYGQTVQKNNKQFTYGQTVQKKQQQFTYGQTVQKTTAIYIWTVHIYRLYRRQCAKYTYIYSVRLVYYRDILNYQRHIIHRMGTSTEKARVFLYTHHVFLRCKEIQKCQVKKRWYARTQTIYSTEYD